MAKLLAKWHITGSKDERHIVTLDRDGNYECSCLSEQCRHIQAIRNRQEFVKLTRGKRKQQVLSNKKFHVSLSINRKV